jgi:acyl-CoA thioesterase FadM
MPRLKLNVPCSTIFDTTIQVRITDLNYGGHMGNDALLSMVHEARVQFFKSIGASELNFFDVSVIMSDVMVQYKSEGFAGDELIFEIGVDDIAERSFDIWYHVFKMLNEEKKEVAIVKTGMMCFDYATRKTANVPNQFKTITNKTII